jgi:uncharacterized membrane protein YfcA
MRITIRQYYTGFASLWGLAAGASFVPALLHAFIPDSSAAAEYLYPPLGDAELIAVAATLGFLLATTFVVFTCCQSARRIHPRVSAILTFGTAVGAGVLIMLHVLFVRHIPVHSLNLDVPVSIGYERTDFALKTYPYTKFDDWSALHDTGPTEEQIQLLWTPHSIYVVRLLLWGSYTFTLGCFLSVVSLAVYQHVVEDISNPAHGPDGAVF